MSLECAICFHVCDIFRILSCGHSFCENCLREMMNGGKIPCPNCRVEHIFPSAVVGAGNPSAVDSLPKKHCGFLTCPVCNNDKSIESDFVWCNECRRSICGMCFLTNHISGHKFTKWTENYPAVSECISYLQSRLDVVTRFESYFNTLRLTVDDEFRSGTKNIKEPLLNILAVLRNEFPTANLLINPTATTMRASDVSSTMKQIVKISHLDLNCDIFDEMNIANNNLCNDIIGVHRHFCLPNLVACFKKPMSTIEVPNLDDFTVIRDEIIQAKVGHGGQIKVTKLRCDENDFSGKLYSIFSCVNVGRYKDDIFIVLGNDTDCSLFNMDSVNGSINGSKNYKGTLCVVESQTNLYCFMNGKISFDVKHPFLNAVKMNVLHQKLMGAVEKPNAVQFIFVDYHMNLEFISCDKDTRVVYEHAKISFDYLLNKSGLLSELQRQQAKRITAVCPLDGEITDFLIVAVEFSTRNAFSGAGTSSFFLYDYHCGSVRFLQNYPTLVFQKLLIREKLLYCLVDLNDVAKKRFVRKTEIVTKRMFLFRLP